MSILCLPAPVRARASAKAKPCIFLRSEASMFGLASLLAWTMAFARSWACLSRGLFRCAMFSLDRRDETSFAYAALAEGLYGMVLVLTAMRRALLANAFNLLE